MKIIQLGDGLTVNATCEQQDPDGVVSMHVQLNGHPEVVVTLGHLYYFCPDNGEECYICMNSDIVAPKTECAVCRHQIHVHCFALMIQNQRKCPLCRAPF